MALALAEGPLAHHNIRRKRKGYHIHSEEAMCHGFALE